MTKKRSTAQAFHSKKHLSFGRCDPAGIAYFPSYLDLLVEVVEEFFAEIGVPWPQLMARQRIGVPTLKLELLFVDPGYHGDQLDFGLSVSRVGKSSLDLHHEVRAGERLLWTAKQRLVATSLDTHSACAWPAEIAAALNRYLEIENA